MISVPARFRTRDDKLIEKFKVATFFETLTPIYRLHQLLQSSTTVYWNLNKTIISIINNNISNKINIIEIILYYYYGKYLNTLNYLYNIILSCNKIWNIRTNSNLTLDAYFVLCKKMICIWTRRYRNHLAYFSSFGFKKSSGDIVKLFSNTSNKPTFFTVTLIATPSLHLQMVVYLELMEVWGRKNGGEVFLWLSFNIKVSVIASYVMGTCRTDVFVSVFCGQWESMEV